MLLLVLFEKNFLLCESKMLATLLTARLRELYHVQL